MSECIRMSLRLLALLEEPSECLSVACAQVEEKALAAQQAAVARIAEMAKTAAPGLPVLGDPGQPQPPSPARAAMAEAAARIEKLYRGATMQLRLNRIAHGARQLGLRPVSLPHGMLKVRRQAPATGLCAAATALRRGVCHPMCLCTWS